MVAGGRAKPWRQKGTGRARAGTTRAPQWTGGGTVFGPSPRRYDLKMNRKAAHKARAMALSRHAAEGTLGVFDAELLRCAEDQGRRSPCSSRGAASGRAWSSCATTRPTPASPSATSSDVLLAEAGSVSVAELLRARSLLVSTGRARRVAGR